MGKKVDEKIAIIKFLLKDGNNQAQIARKTKYSKQTVSRLVKKIKGKGANDKKNNNKDRTKLPKKYFNKIIEMATNKTTSQMSGGAISNLINEELQNKNILNKKGKF